jgi:hypothetical protein
MDAIFNGDALKASMPSTSVEPTDLSPRNKSKAGGGGAKAVGKAVGKDSPPAQNLNQVPHKPQDAAAGKSSKSDSRPSGPARQQAGGSVVMSVALLLAYLLLICLLIQHLISLR